MFFPRSGQLVVCERNGREAIVHLYTTNCQWIIIDVLTRESYTVSVEDLKPCVIVESMLFEQPSPVALPLSRVTMPSFTVSAAPRSTTRCLNCDRAIELGGLRLAIAWKHFLGMGRIIDERIYFHMQCFRVKLMQDCNVVAWTGYNSLSDTQMRVVLGTLMTEGTMQAREGDPNTMTFEDFTKAARIAISAQVHRFKIDALAEAIASPLKCPFSPDTVLDANNSHVHHDSESKYGFRDLARRFYDKQMGQKWSMRLVRGEFVDPALSLEFAEYHRIHAHLRLVSQTANLSLLKSDKIVRLCDNCKSSSNVAHLPEFRTWLCSSCRKQSFRCQLHAMRVFVLRVHHISQLTHSTLPNPCFGGRGRHFAPMKVYHIDALMQQCIAVHGSIDAAMEKRTSMNQRRDERKRKRDEAVAATEYSLRSRQNVSITTWNAAVKLAATAPTPVGQ